MADISDISRDCIPDRCTPSNAAWISKQLTVDVAAPLFLTPHSVPRIARATLLLSVTGFVVVLCTLLGLKKQTQPGSFITQKGLGTSGWGEGMAWMLGVGNALCDTREPT